MNYSIRPYQNSDFSEISNWYEISTGQRPPEGLLVNDGTFVVEVEGIPILSWTVFKTQSKEICYLECFIKNPKVKVSLEVYGQLLFNHCASYARDCGFKRIVGFTHIPQLRDKCERFGMTCTLNNASILSKEL